MQNLVFIRVYESNENLVPLCARMDQFLFEMGEHSRLQFYLTGNTWGILSNLQHVGLLYLVLKYFR